jgi:hypothetical protein
VKEQQTEKRSVSEVDVPQTREERQAAMEVSDE